MAVTTTEFNNLLEKLRADHPHLRFEEGSSFHWSPNDQTVYYEVNGDDLATLLHETAHGVLGHSSYGKDTELLHLERDAWSTAVRLGRKYSISIHENTIEDSIDTYRDWIHARSLCPKCQQNGIQAEIDTYRCLLCESTWKVNEARNCGLKRTLTN